MKHFKKATALLLTMVMIFSFNGCARGTPEDFDQFLSSLPSQMMSAEDMTVHFTFNDPEAYGFEPAILELPFSDESDYQATKEEIKGMLNQLSSFDYRQLNDSQKLHYDILKDYMERQLLTLDFSGLDNNYLGSFVGFQAQLPMLFNEFTIQNKSDLDSYFHLLETTEETFLKYADLERLRQEQKVGMGQTIMHKVIEQCENFSNGDNNFLIDGMNAKISAADFLTEQEKQEAKTKNADLVNHKFVPAYQTLGKALSEIEVKSSDLGLATKPGGKAYYTALLKQQTGIDTSIPDLKAYLEEVYQQNMTNMMLLLQKYPELKELDISNVKYSDFASAEQTLDYLKTRIFEDYPEVDHLVYKVIPVPESMKENFSPAAYLVSKIDKNPEDPESIYINGDYDQSLFPTIAHEGYPGHMYQNVYFHSLNLPLIRYMLSYNGYSEGWATYIEMNSWKYAPAEDKAALELLAYNQKVTEAVIGLADIGIHYEGWTREAFFNMLKEYGLNAPDEAANDQFDMILEIPTTYLQYYLNGLYYQDLYDSTEEALDDAFDPIEFHRVLLETGPSSFKILQNQVDRYIASVEEETVLQPAA